MKAIYSKNYPIYLFYLYLIIWTILAFNVSDRPTWWLENVLVFIVVPLLIWKYKRFRLSNISYTLIFLFMVLHTFGSHYSYANVPLGQYLQTIFGFQRNHFDRIVHFSFGLLMAYPIREIFLRIANTKGAWGYYLPFDVTLSFSAIYEILEWLTALVFAPELADSFLGQQGDNFDAIKDMALAGTGALITMIVTAIINYKYYHNFKKDIVNSFKIRRKTPLGEIRFREYKQRLSKIKQKINDKKKSIKTNSEIRKQIKKNKKQLKKQNRVKNDGQ